MTAEHTPPTAAERIADQLHDLASLARRGYAISPETIAGLASDVKQLGGLVAGSDDSTDTLIEQLTPTEAHEVEVHWQKGLAIVTAYDDRGNPTQADGPTLDAAWVERPAQHAKGT